MRIIKFCAIFRSLLLALKPTICSLDHSQITLRSFVETARAYALIQAQRKHSKYKEKKRNLVLEIKIISSLLGSEQQW